MGEHAGVIAALLQRAQSALLASEPALDALGRAGVPRTAIFGAAGLQGAHCGMSRAQTHPCGLWEPADTGPMAVVLAALDDDGDAIDLVAFRLGSPGQWWRLGGVAPLLGSAHDTRPVHLHAMPLDWLCAGGQGCCVVDWSYPLRELFAGVPAIIFPGEALRQRFERTWAEQARPPVLTAPSVTPPSAIQHMKHWL